MADLSRGRVALVVLLDVEGRDGGDRRNTAVAALAGHLDEHPLSPVEISTAGGVVRKTVDTVAVEEISQAFTTGLLHIQPQADR
jgi:hypothetical protein